MWVPVPPDQPPSGVAVADGGLGPVAKLLGTGGYSWWVGLGPVKTGLVLECCSRQSGESTAECPCPWSLPACEISVSGQPLPQRSEGNVGVPLWGLSGTVLGPIVAPT